MPATPAAPGAPPAPAPAPVAERRSFPRRVVGGIRQRWRSFSAWVGRVFPTDTDEPRTPSGLAAEVPYGWLYTVFALALGVVFAVLWVVSTEAYPIPPGVDPSTWLLTSYAYVGLAHASVSSLFGYPPLSFPFLGLATIAGGGPLNGGRLYIAAVMLAFGFGVFFLARSLLVRPSLALLTEGLMLAEPHFLQIYYFGGYPNLFALVFLVISLGFLMRFLRSRRQSHLLGFWLAVAGCVLAHSLSAVVLAATLLFASLGLVVAGRLPRTLLVSRAGALGAGIVAAGLGAYYGITALSNIGHPSYFVTGGTTSSSLLPSALTPLYLSTIYDVLAGSTSQVSTTAGFDFVVGASVAMLLLFLGFRWMAPKYLTTPWILLAAMFLAPFAGITAAYVLNVVTDYRRFQYFLYVPAILLLMYFADLALTHWASERAVDALPPLPGHTRRRWRFTRSGRRAAWLDVLLTLALVGIVGASAVVYTVPLGLSYESYYAKTGHDQAMLDAINAMTASGIPGNVLSASIYAGHWPSALSQSRITYEVPLLASTGQQYTPIQVLDGELASITLGARYTATDGYVSASIPGAAGTNFNSTPLYGVFSSDAYRQVLRLQSSSVLVGFSTGASVIVAPSGQPAPPIVPIAGGLGYSLTFVNPLVTVNETVTTLSSSPTALVNFNATAAPGLHLSYLEARLATISGVRTIVANGPTNGSFSWLTEFRSGNVSTFANLTPASALAKVTPYNAALNISPSILIKSVPATASNDSSLAFSLNLTTPGLVNVFPRPGPWIAADQQWENWSVRWILVYNSAASPGLPLVAYLETEYGATVETVAGPWWLLLLPSPIPGPVTIAGAGPPTGPVTR